MPPQTSGATGNDRVVIHLDLDAFYAQVETSRLGLAPDVPLAVQQWQGIIAVNYPARAAGVKRHLTVAEAKRQCPALHLVHVETIGEDEDDGEETTAPLSDKNVAPSRPGPDARETAEIMLPVAAAPDRDTRKVTLRRYREASKRVMAALTASSPGAVVERASIDEAYLDVTAEVDAIARESREFTKTTSVEDTTLESSAALADAVARGVRASGLVGAFDPRSSASDLRLAVGAMICARARAKVLADAGFTMSGGVAHNKMLAKLASARNKPDKQTVVGLRAAAQMLDTLPMRSIRGMGGKFGERAEQALVTIARERVDEFEPPGRDRVAVSTPLGAVGGSHYRTILAAQLREMAKPTGRGSSSVGGFTAAALAAVPAAELIRVGGFDRKEADWLLRVARGEDPDPVVANADEGPKSVCAFKSFQSTDDPDRVARWLRVLSKELAGRLAEDRRRHRRVPRGLRLEYRRGHSGLGSRARSMPFPPEAARALLAASVEEEDGLGSDDSANDSNDSNADSRREKNAARRAERASFVERAADRVAERAIREFERLGAAATLPCTRVGLAAAEFFPAPNPRGGIAEFFNRKGDADQKTKSVTAREENEGVSAGARDPERRLGRDASPRRRGLDRFFAAPKPNPEPERKPERANDRPGSSDEKEGLERGSERFAGGSSPEEEPPSRAKKKRSEELPAGSSGPLDSATFSDAPSDEEGGGGVEDVFWTCARCGERCLSARDAQTHADAHVAYDLARAEPQHRAVGHVAKRKRAPRRPKPTSKASGGGGGKPLASFFERRPTDGPTSEIV